MRVIIVTLISLLFLCLPVKADELGEANKLLVTAVKLQQAAEISPSPIERQELYKKALSNLLLLIDRYPSTDVAVKLITNQNVGSLNIGDLKAQVQSLDLPSCLSDLTFHCLIAQAKTETQKLSKIGDRALLLAEIIIAKLNVNQTYADFEADLNELKHVLKDVPHQRKNYNSRLISMIAIRLAEHGKYDAAIQLSLKTKNSSAGMSDGTRDRTLEDLAAKLISDDKLNEAIDLLNHFEAKDRGGIGATLTDIAIAYAKIGKLEPAQRWLERAYSTQAAQRSGLYSSRIAEKHVSIGAFGSNYTIETKLPNGTINRIGAIAGIIIGASKLGPVSLKNGSLVVTDGSKKDFLGQPLNKVLKKINFKREISSTPRQILNEFGVSLKIVEAYSAVGETDEALKFISSNLDAKNQGYPLETLAMAMVKRGELRGALKLLEMLKAKRLPHHEISQDIAIAFSKIGQLKQALSLIDGIQNDSWKGHTLHTVMENDLSMQNLQIFFKKSQKIKSKQWQDGFNSAYALLHWKADRKKEAVAFYKRIRSTWRKENVSHQIADLLFYSGIRHDSAELDIDELSILKEKLQEVLRSKAVAHGDTKLAVKLIEVETSTKGRAGLLIQTALRIAAGEQIKLPYPVSTKSISITANPDEKNHHASWRAEATDFAAPLGTDVFSVADGKVLFVQNSAADGKKSSASLKCGKAFELGDQSIGRGCMGNFLTIEHSTKFGMTFYASYLHLKQNSISVRIGDKIKSGQAIAEIGNTGLRSGPHLHFQPGTQLLDASKLNDKFFVGKIADGTRRNERLIVWEEH